MKKLLAAGAIATAMVGSIVWGTSEADAEPGKYTEHGDVLVTVAVSNDYCATVAWPKGGTNTKCGFYQVIHEDIVPGDTFGASIISYSGGGVSCSVVDLATGDLIWSDFAAGGYRANCIREAE